MLKTGVRPVQCVLPPKGYTEQIVTTDDPDALDESCQGMHAEPFHWFHSKECSVECTLLPTLVLNPPVRDGRVRADRGAAVFSLERSGEHGRVGLIWRLPLSSDQNDLARRVAKEINQLVARRLPTTRKRPEISRRSFGLAGLRLISPKNRIERRLQHSVKRWLLAASSGQHNCRQRCCTYWRHSEHVTHSSSLFSLAPT